MKPQANFPVLLESFFTQRLINQRQASPHTIASYRDTFTPKRRAAPSPSAPLGPGM